MTYVVSVGVASELKRRRKEEGAEEEEGEKEGVRTQKNLFVYQMTVWWLECYTRDRHRFPTDALTH